MNQTLQKKKPGAGREIIQTHSSPPFRAVDLLAIGLVVVIWGVAFAGMKEMVKDAPPFKAGGIRFLIAALPLMVFALKPERFKKLRKGDLFRFALIGLLQTTVLFGINFTAIQHAPVGISSILINTHPFFVAILAHLFLKGDRLSRQKVAGLIIGFSGVVALVVSGKSFGDVAFYWPVLLLTSAVVWASSSVLIKKFEFQDVLSMTAWQALFGCLPLLVIGFGVESQPVNWTGSFIFWTFYTAILGSTFAWLAWARLLKRYSASRVTVFAFLVPVCGVISGVVLLGESLTLNMVVGGTLVAAGIVLVNIRLERFSSPKLLKPRPTLNNPRTFAAPGRSDRTEESLSA